MAKEKSRIKEPIRELIQTKNAPGALGTYIFCT